MKLIFEKAYVFSISCIAGPSDFKKFLTAGTFSQTRTEKLVEQK
jgi:hypothetical protein